MQEANWYLLVVASLLAIGLYASTYGIVLKEARQHLKIILSAVTVGVVLKAAIIGGINIWSGIALGVAAYCAQIIVGWLLTRGLPTRDRWHISFAQQNGITAIILALLFEPIHPGTVAIVAPAIIVINGLHYLVNKGLDKYVLHERKA